MKYICAAAATATTLIPPRVSRISDPRAEDNRIVHIDIIGKYYYMENIIYIAT